MTSRRDQAHAYRFLTRRIVSAMLVGEPETNELPMRRFTMAIFGSLLIGAVTLAGFGIYGFLRPGGSRPVPNVIVVERESGAKYLYLDGKLHPVLNWTSARLVLEQAEPVVRTMSQASLRDVPRGRPIGIDGAPDTLPARAALLGLPWTVCSAPRTASTALASQVFVGAAPTGGTPLGGDAGVLVSGGDQRYLLWREHRLLVRSSAALVALRWAAIRPVPVAEALLNAVPSGPDLASLAIPDAGVPARRGPGGREARVGQIYRASGQYYVTLRDGLAPIGEVVARLTAAVVGPAIEISAGDAGQVLVDQDVEPDGFPAVLPEVRGADEPVSAVCAVYRDPGAADPVVVQTYPEAGPELTIPAEQPPATRGVDGVFTADRVAVAGGRGALVRAQPVPGGAATGTVYLVTDLGLKYPLAGKDVGSVQASLGYEGVSPVPVPAAILALVPTAVTLDPRAAARFSSLPTMDLSDTRRPAHAAPVLSRPSTGIVPDPYSRLVAWRM